MLKLIITVRIFTWVIYPNKAFCAYNCHSSVSEQKLRLQGEKQMLGNITTLPAALSMQGKVSISDSVGAEVIHNYNSYSTGSKMR